MNVDNRARRLEAFAWGAPVGTLGGLVGLGGGEFRIPILLHRFETNRELGSE